MKKHKMTAADLVVWMETHKEAPVFEVLGGKEIRILKARQVGASSVDLTVQSGDETPHGIRVRWDMQVSFLAPNDPVQCPS